MPLTTGPRGRGILSRLVLVRLRTPAASTSPAIPVAFTGRTSTLLLQDPVASLRRQAYGCVGY